MGYNENFIRATKATGFHEIKIYMISFAHRTNHCVKFMEKPTNYNLVCTPPPRNPSRYRRWSDLNISNLYYNISKLVTHTLHTEKRNYGTIAYSKQILSIAWLETRLTQINSNVNSCLSFYVIPKKRYLKKIILVHFRSYLYGIKFGGRTTCFL